MKQPETPLTREQIEAWRNLGAAYVEHMPDGEAMFTALCDAALRGLARQEGQEPRGCPTPGACSCPAFDPPEDESANAPWLTAAHILCTDQGIPPGHISDRIETLRVKLDSGAVEETPSEIERPLEKAY